MVSVSKLSPIISKCRQNCKSIVNVKQSSEFIYEKLINKKNEHFFSLFLNLPVEVVSITETSPLLKPALLLASVSGLIFHLSIFVRFRKVHYYYY